MAETTKRHHGAEREEFAHECVTVFEEEIEDGRGAA